MAVLRSWVSCFLVLSGAGCVRPVQGPLAGASDAWAAGAETPEHSAPTPSPVWDQYAAAQQWAPVNPAPFTSRGHEPEQAVDVRVSPASLATYSALVADSVFADGSVLTELPHTPGGFGYGMQKAGATWSFFELDARGGLISSGNLALCVGCHAQAPADDVFGLPRPPTDG